MILPNKQSNKTHTEMAPFGKCIAMQRWARNRFDCGGWGRRRRRCTLFTYYHAHEKWWKHGCIIEWVDRTAERSHGLLQQIQWKSFTRYSLALISVKPHHIVDVWLMQMYCNCTTPFPHERISSGFSSSPPPLSLSLSYFLSFAMQWFSRKIQIAH